ncbi:MAG: hypothetical protein KTR31_28705 [Myxococcales bacterium]|nr:hypothetical protein [Myxococcales bacterium]
MMCVLWTSLGWGGELAPGAEPDLETEVRARVAPTVGLFGGTASIGVSGIARPSERLAIGAGVDGLAPGAFLPRAGARWLLAQPDESGNGVALAAVLQGAAMTRFTGRIDTWAVGAGLAVHARLDRFGASLSVPVGVRGNAQDLRVGPTLAEGSLYLRTGSEHQGTFRVGMATTAGLTHITYARSTRWGQWRFGLLVTPPGIGLSLPLEAGFTL